MGSNDGLLKGRRVRDIRWRYNETLTFHKKLITSVVNVYPFIDYMGDYLMSFLDIHIYLIIFNHF